MLCQLTTPHLLQARQALSPSSRDEPRMYLEVQEDLAQPLFWQQLMGHHLPVTDPGEHPPPPPPRRWKLSGAQARPPAAHKPAHKDPAYIAGGDSHQDHTA